ncbi:MAG TPA: TonB family protein [Bryobacteraceae bacterium]|nr:TonB family protein [Bryobacteraceae bacterium]
MPHLDILDQPESLRNPLAGSLALHASVAAFIVFFSTYVGPHSYWGSNTPGGGSAMVVNVVGQVPLPSRGGIVNPVANDTKSEVPEPKPDKIQRTKVKEPEPDAIPLRSRATPKKPSRVESSTNLYRARQIDRPNQLYSQEGQALVSPMVGQTGSGGVGVGRGSPFGDRYGFYVDILRQKVAQHWRTGDVDPRIRSAPPVIVTFSIRRDGTISGVRVAQTSGNLALDLSAQRAIADAAPFPALPAGYTGNDVGIEFWFELKR